DESAFQKHIGPALERWARQRIDETGAAPNTDARHSSNILQSQGNAEAYAMFQDFLAWQDHKASRDTNTTILTPAQRSERAHELAVPNEDAPASAVPAARNEITDRPPKEPGQRKFSWLSGWLSRIHPAEALRRALLDFFEYNQRENEPTVDNT